MDEVRLDKWLWAARFYKTRSLAVEEIVKGRVNVNGQTAKPARTLKVGDKLDLRREGETRTVQVMGLSNMRGPAPVAQLLYAETAESLALHERHVQERRLGAEPAQHIEQGRPTKRDRRKLADWTDITALLLVVEVISPSSARYDRQLKRLRYQRARVPEYWVVDLDARVVERWRPDDERPEILTERLRWELAPGAAPVEFDLAAYFADVCGSA